MKLRYYQAFRRIRLTEKPPATVSELAYRQAGK
jgi:hypothetical protein